MPAMDFQYPDFDTAHFRADPRRTAVGPWTIDHVSFGTPATASRTPVLFLGGAFQNAWSFSREVKHFLPQRPILIVDLPGQGQNNQLSGELTFADLAGLLREFLVSHNVSQVIPVGLSYGSGIAFTFAQRSPDLTERLILGVSTAQIRPRVDKALRTGFWYLDRGRHNEFADGVIHHLLNLPLREQTGATQRLIEALRTGMLQLTDVERLRYRHNTERLFRDWLAGSVACRTLVFTAKFDSFTTPSEGLALARQCPASEFVMFDRGDHLAPIEHPKTAIALYDAFVNDRPLSAIDGLMTGNAPVEACKERRMLQRRDGRRRDVRLHGPNDHQARAALLDYNAHGCLLELTDDSLVAIRDEPVEVIIPAIGAKGAAVLLPDARGARAVFLHDAFGTLGTVPVATVELPVPRETPGGTRRISVAERLLAVTE